MATYRRLLMEAVTRLQESERQRMKGELWSPRGSGRDAYMNRCSIDCPGWFVEGGTRWQVSRCDECSDHLPDWGYEGDDEAARAAIAALRVTEGIPRPVLEALPCVEDDDCELCLLELIYPGYSADLEYQELSMQYGQGYNVTALRDEIFLYHASHSFLVMQDEIEGKCIFWCEHCEEELSSFPIPRRE